MGFGGMPVQSLRVLQAETHSTTQKMKQSRDSEGADAPEDSLAAVTNIGLSKHTQDVQEGQWQSCIDVSL